YEIPCKLNHKKSVFINRAYDPTLSLLNIEDYGYGHYYGLTVDRDELFMLEDYTVVHNTKFIISLVRGMLENEKNVAVEWFSMEDERQQIIRSFLSMDVKMTTKELQSINYQINETDIKRIEDAAKHYEKFNVEFYDRIASIATIVARCKRFGERFKNHKKVI